MALLLMTVEDTFDIRGRGLVLVPGVSHDVACRVQDWIEVRRPNGTSLSTRIAGIEGIGVPVQRVLCLPPEIRKTDVPIGSEIWLSSSAVTP